MQDKANFGESSSDQHGLRVNKAEILKLSQQAKYWEYICSFCFKAFPSAQSLGGHQNAHRNERMKEKKLYIKDPVGYRRQTYLRSAHRPKHDLLVAPASLKLAEGNRSEARFDLNFVLPVELVAKDEEFELDLTLKL